MLLSRRGVLAGAGVQVLAASVLAAPARAAETPWLTPADIDLTVLLPPPPEKGGAADRRDLEAVLAAQAAASPERIARAAADAAERIYVMFTSVLGPRFAPEALPKADPLFRRAEESEDAVVDPAKPFFGRVRPWLADARVKALVPSSKSGSWPSGHTTRVTMLAAVLTAMVPEKRAAIWERSFDYAESRVIGGMHYPSDLAAGRSAGTAMAAVLFAKPEFRADFPAAKAELRQVLAL